jgi:hypothetical protein
MEHEQPQHLSVSRLFTRLQRDGMLTAAAL